MEFPKHRWIKKNGIREKNKKGGQLFNESIPRVRWLTEKNVIRFPKQARIVWGTGNLLHEWFIRLHELASVLNCARASRNEKANPSN